MVNFHGMGMPSFDFDGVNSLTTYNLRLTAKPSIPTPQQRAERITVGGRDSYVTFTDGTYENITITVPVRLRVLEAQVQTAFQNIRDWLMRKNFWGGGPSLQFSHYPNWTYEVYEWKPYTWEYHPPTGEYFTTFEIECRPYKKSIITDTIVIDNVGDPVMSPWMTFRAQDKDQWGNPYYEAGAYECLDDEDISMLDNFGLVDGWQNSNGLVPRLQATDGSGIALKAFRKADLQTQRNFVYNFYDITTDSNGNAGRWNFNSNYIIVDSGRGLSCKAGGGLQVAKATYTTKNISDVTGSQSNTRLYVNFSTTTPADVKVSIYEVDNSFVRVKTLLASGRDGSSFSLADMTAYGNRVQVSIEFNNPTRMADINDFRITRTLGSPYNPTFLSYSAFHVKSNIIEMAKTLDMFVFNNSDDDATKLKAIQDRNPEIIVHQAHTLNKGATPYLNNCFYQVSGGRGSNRRLYLMTNDVTEGTKVNEGNVLQPVTSKLTVSGAVSLDNKLHHLTKINLKEDSGDVPAPNTALLDEFYIKMRMMVRPTTTRIYDNNGGERAPMLIRLVARGGNAKFEWRNAAGGVFTPFTLALPVAQQNRDITIDTENKLVYDSLTGIPLTQYCFGDFPECQKGQRMEYRINNDVLKATIEITKRKL
ncbi:hypothetical protein [Bacillus anthracis]|uniref:hypothetical protein n=2 Tax=Bacillus TaxID=1386 RepID=UPI001E1231EC|nr:hypothetical protein [Bacillus cereus]